MHLSKGDFVFSWQQMLVEKVQNFATFSDSLSRFFQIT